MMYIYNSRRYSNIQSEATNTFKKHNKNDIRFDAMCTIASDQYFLIDKDNKYLKYITAVAIIVNP